MSGTIEELLQWEQFSRDTIGVKRVYVDTAGDLVSGILLSQIIYWYLPGKDGKTKLRIRKNGEFWIAKGRDEWWDECRLTARQFDRASKNLVGKGLITKEVFKFKGTPTVHVKLNAPVLLTSVKRILTKGENPSYQKRQFHLTETSRSLTETTTKTTTEPTKNVRTPSGDSDVPFEDAAESPKIELPAANQEDRAPKFGEGDTPYELAKHLRACILDADPDTKVPEPSPAALESWSFTADRMLRLDDRQPEEAARLMEWCQEDEFWRANILSMDKFRKQYDRLKRQRDQERNKSGGHRPKTYLEQKLEQKGVI